MKKLFSCFVCLFISLICVLGFSACGEKNDASTVKLVAIEANSVGVMDNIDYYVVPEPAASAKVKAVSDLNFVGDLQSLYGGENGYPQAVVVAKNSLLGTDVLNEFVSALSSANEWLMDDTNSIETIVNSIQLHLTAGMEPSIKVQNLTKSVIKNCGIKFVSASDSKSEISTFMAKFNAISESSFGMPHDEFFYNGEVGTIEYTQKISVYAPDGAPALGLAKLMTEDCIENIEYHVVNAGLIQTFVGKADICVLPVNVAVKLLGDAQNYKMIGTLTHGNLYLLSKNNKKISVDNLSELKGKTVGIINLAQVPGLTFKLILQNYGIEFTESYND